jgi:CelD/BcsL family acetyltransferase involved in cellulose biosynthesis
MRITGGLLMPFRIARGKEASEMLKNERFLAEWRRLYRECPWSTVAQSPAFVTSWYATYREYRPLVVCEFSASQEMIGLLPLAMHPSGQAVLPGARQAEYQSWLAIPSNGKSFLEASLSLLSRNTAIGALSFRYLPCGVPLGRADSLSTLPWTCELELHRRPIVRLSDASEVAEYVRQKTNSTIRNSWNRLKRMGNVRLEQIRETTALDPIFDQLIEWYDTRQEMAHGKKPFQMDKNKKVWHLRLLQEGLLHLTLLKVGERIASAIFGASDSKTYSVMMPVFAPEYGRYSPIAIHHLSLVEQLHADGYSVLDLTPGPDAFKERFAGTYETVSALSIYFKQRAWFKAKVRQQSQAFTKGVLSALGIAPSTVLRTLPRIHALLKWKRPERQTDAKTVA